MIVHLYIRRLYHGYNEYCRLYLHARNCFGMPDHNDSAVVMKFADISKLEEYLCSLSLELNTTFFE